MILPHHINALDTANKALSKAWNAVLKARQYDDPIALQNAVMRYCYTLQRVNVAIETAITTK